MPGSPGPWLQTTRYAFFLAPVSRTLASTVPSSFVCLCTVPNNVYFDVLSPRFEPNGDDTSANKVAQHPKDAFFTTDSETWLPTVPAVDFAVLMAVDVAGNGRGRCGVGPHIDARGDGVKTHADGLATGP